MTLTKDKINEIRSKVLEALHNQVDSLTRPACPSPAGFTKRQGENIKAGMTDGVNCALVAVLKGLGL